MTYYATIDTNVLVSALLTKNSDAATVKIFQLILEEKIIPLYNEEILEEYRDVLQRKKFHFEKELIEKIVRAIECFGHQVDRVNTEIKLADMDDLVFYEVTMARRDENAYLVTGNKKHFPKEPCIVTPNEMLDIIYLI